MQLTQKRLVITGGTSGIGYELVKQLHSDNEIIIIARNAEKLKKLKAEFNNVRICQADLSNLDEVEYLAAKLKKDYDRIDGIIHNAAIQNTPAFDDEAFDYKSIEKEITLNFTAICCLTSLLLPLLIHKERSFILNMGSGLGLVPKTASAVYSATKGAINIFSQSLRHQLAHHNIQVFQALMPLVDTPMTHGRGQDKMTAAAAAREVIKGIKKEIPNHDIGKVKFLRLILRLWPKMAENIMKNA